jgi:two-component system response regulator HydG
LASCHKPLQAKLLRVLATGEVQRVGSVSTVKVDVHVVAATNRDLRAESAAGRFRNDLFYRLNVVELRVPALRERREDIPYLTAAFVRESAARLNKTLVGLTPAAERALVSGAWEGNVRELRNVVERACILADSEFIRERDFTSSVSQISGLPVGSRREAAVPEHGDALSNVEREHIVDVLARAGGNKAKAARMLGLDRRSLYRRLEAYRIESSSINRDQ